MSGSIQLDQVDGSRHYPILPIADDLMLLLLIAVLRAALAYHFHRRKKRDRAE